ncbi:RNA binding family protein isoform 2 [Hibiscus syriacus]|uniref:RNA binding family protein isoform 2 n=1 Tax=Hibiscus syriacus TaxID=106335 RepID=A0A6A3B7G9_HIBSY|nr:RNA binding family protein isoform 2 [Hibiscus syriacus]
MMSSLDGSHNHQQSGTENSLDSVADVDWYILGEDQQNIGPYSVSELRVSSGGGVALLNSMEGEKSNAVPSNDAEAEAERLKNGSVSRSIGDGFCSDDQDRPLTPPEGEEGFTDDDGTRYKWDKSLRAWVPQDDTSTKNGDYGVEEMTFLKEDDVFPTIAAASSAAADASGRDDVNGNGELTEVSCDTMGKLLEKPVDKKEANKPPDSWFELKVNTHVYVTGLPDDVTAEELVEVFSKCGIIKELFKFWMEHLYILMERPLCLSAKLNLSKSPAVQISLYCNNARDKFIAKQVDSRKKKKLKKFEDRMLSWGGRHDAKVTIPATVVFRNMFIPAETRADENLSSELEEDVKEECSKLGPLDSVKIHASEDDGVVNRALVRRDLDEDAGTIRF